MALPDSIYRNAIDLNRYSNSVSRRIINEYNNIIVEAANQLKEVASKAADNEINNRLMEVQNVHEIYDNR